MKKKFMSLLLAGTMAAVSMIPTTVAYADSQKVVTIGADLTEDQKNAVLRYFGVLGTNNYELIYINNQQEREHLAGYVPIEQIGTKTFSCALVKPTTSGGIQVKTANLSWVTSNMIASTLSTSGVVNCEVLAASPFEVSGTGALTGILMAYEQASGTELSSEKKEVATQELVTTGQIADTVGQTQATEIVNEIKIQIIEGKVVEPEQVTQIVNEVVDQVEQDAENAQSAEPTVVQLSEEDRARLDDLAQQIAQQQYDYEEMRETLERVENNVEEINNSLSQDEAGAETTETYDEGTQTEDAAEPETLAEDSILLNTDDSALGEGVIIDATNEEAAPTTEAQETNAEEEADPFEITSTDATSTEETSAEETSADAETTEETAAPAENQDGENSEANGSETEVLPEDTAAAPEISEIVLVQDNSEDTQKNITGSSILRFDAPLTGLSLTGGQLTITDAFGTTVADVDLSITLRVASEPMESDALAQRGWTEGTEFLVNLGDGLTTAGTYTVTMNAQIAQAPDGVDPLSVPAAEVSFTKDINVGNNGFSLPASDMTYLLAGSQVSGTVLYDASTAIYAMMTIENEDVATSDVYEFDIANGLNTFNLYLNNTGKTDVTVTFYDVDGNEIDSCTQTVEVF